MYNWRTVGLFIFASAFLWIGVGCEEGDSAKGATTISKGISLRKLRASQAPVGKVYDLKTFKLREALSARDLFEESGLPNRYAEQGVTWLVYDLNTGEKLWLLFRQPGFTSLQSAFVKTRRNGQEQERPVFIAGDPHAGDLASN